MKKTPRGNVGGAEDGVANSRKSCRVKENGGFLIGVHKSAKYDFIDFQGS